MAVLLNHYGTAEALSEATGIPAKSLRSVFNTVFTQGKNSRVIESDTYKSGFAAARKRMNDHLRSRIRAASKGRYEAPIVRTQTTVIEPEVYRSKMLQRDYAGHVRWVEAKSLWYSYNVEFLSDDEIFELIERLFDTFMATGQFNTMRIEYLTVADIYSGGRFRDKELKEQARENEVIKLSSGNYPFAEQYIPSDYADYWSDWWHEMQLRGGVRMTGLFFSNMEDLETSPMTAMARADYFAYKQEMNKSRKRGNGNTRKKGRGRGI